MLDAEHFPNWVRCEKNAHCDCIHRMVHCVAEIDGHTYSEWIATAFGEVSIHTHNLYEHIHIND